MNESDTPRTKAASKRALEMLKSCNNETEYKHAVMAIVSDLLNMAKELEVENEMLKIGNH